MNGWRSTCFSKIIPKKFKIQIKESTEQIGNSSAFSRRKPQTAMQPDFRMKKCIISEVQLRCLHLATQDQDDDHPEGEPENNKE